VELNLPPGVIMKMAQKAGITDKVNETDILNAISKRLALRFREIVIP
jgi:hypothetical protein